MPEPAPATTSSGPSVVSDGLALRRVQVGEVLLGRGNGHSAMLAAGTLSYAPVNSVSCIPSGACTRALRSPQGVVTGSATCDAPAIDQAARGRLAVGHLECEPAPALTRAGPPRPRSTVSACASSNSSSVARPAAEQDDPSAVRAPVGDLLQPERVAVEARARRSKSATVNTTRNSVASGISSRLYDHPSARTSSHGLRTARGKLYGHSPMLALRGEAAASAPSAPRHPRAARRGGRVRRARAQRRPQQGACPARTFFTGLRRGGDRGPGCRPRPPSRSSGPRSRGWRRSCRGRETTACRWWSCSTASGRASASARASSAETGTAFE